MKKMLAVLGLMMALVSGMAMASGGGVPTGKTYKVDLSAAAKIGANQLPAGAYNVAVDAASVRFVEVKTGKSTEIAAKVETGEKKFQGNTITTQKVGEEIEIREIRLGGTKIQLNFR